MPSEGNSKKPCCLVSELLEECGVDREKIRQVRRQVLEGVILFCQWQLQRLEQNRRPDDAKKARKVAVD